MEYGGKGKSGILAMFFTSAALCVFITCPGEGLGVGGGTVTCAVNTLPVLQSRAGLVHREMLRCIDCSLSLSVGEGGGWEGGGQRATCEPIKCQWIQIV